MEKSTDADARCTGRVGAAQLVAGCLALLALLGLVACGDAQDVQIAQREPSVQPSEQIRFRDPTGTVACSLGADGVQCDVAEREWSPGPPPEDCVLDWGNGVVLDSRGATLTCASDSLLGVGDVLREGTIRRAGGFQCDVGSDGVTCNSAGGAGFHLSRLDWEVWNA